MQHRREPTPNQPALIPIAGNYDRKPRSLDRDVTTIGRARGTDLCLESNEISTLHCIIYRTAAGYRLRDCNSRCGTRVNGETVKTCILHSTDIVNIGSFSFEFHQPAALFAADAIRADPEKIEHWMKSRRRLAQRALLLRKRLAAGSSREQEWAQKANLLKDKIRSYDARLNDLEDAEKELDQERSELETQAELQQRRVQALENELAERLKNVDMEIHQKWQAFQQRCRAEERAAAKKEPGSAEADAHSELANAREQLRSLEEQWARHNENWQREQQEFNNMKEQWVKDQAKSAASHEKQEAALHAQKTELMRMMGELRSMQDSIRQQAKPDVRALQQEVERLSRENADVVVLREDNLRLQLELETARQHDAGSDVPDDFVRQLDDLRAEINLLTEELRTKEASLQELQQRPAGDQHHDVEQLRAENALLKQLLEERSTEPAPRAEPQLPKSESDLELYETELNEYRRQLDTDRNKLNREVETLRERNKELDEAIREMEMEMSKERAELARERMRLERVREEVKADMERMQRESSVRDSMGPVQRLREEIAGKNGKGGNDRLRTIRDLPK